MLISSFDALTFSRARIDAQPEQIFRDYCECRDWRVHLQNNCVEQEEFREFCPSVTLNLYFKLNESNS